MDKDTRNAVVWAIVATIDRYDTKLKYHPNPNAPEIAKAIQLLKDLLLKMNRFRATE